MTRAREWVADAVPYCGGVRGGPDLICGGTCERPSAPWNNYRSDCSGYVSWAWEITDDPATATYKTDRAGSNGWTTIAINSLEAGDAVVTDGHIKLFSHFVDADTMDVLEESDCGEVAHEAVQNFTRSGNTLKFSGDSRTYHPIRRNGLTPACTVGGAILAHYNALGGTSSYLGSCVTSELGTPDGVGRYNHFQGGSIYWTASTGAFAVQGAIRNEWAAEGWERSPMGYPLTDESGTPDGIGRYNHFQGGSIYWTAATDAHEVQGAIHTKWAQLGWERSALGYPTTNESGTPDGIGRFNHFQGGSIYWTAATDAHEVQDAIYNKWAAMGWERSALGYPLTDESGTPDGVGRFNHFQGGSIYWTAATGAHEVEGEIHTKWAQLGWETMLGYPITDETATPDGVGQYSQFEHGFIFWSPSSGAHDILGAIFNKWVTFAAEAGELGYPTSDETATTCGGGRKNAFQGGAVYWTAALGAHVVPGAVRTMYTSLQAECGSLGFPTGDPATLGDGGVLYAFEHGALILSPSGVVTVQ